MCGSMDILGVKMHDFIGTDDPLFSQVCNNSPCLLFWILLSVSSD